MIFHPYFYKCYCGSAVVIAGERCSYGEDLNEVIIEDTVVIAIA